MSTLAPLALTAALLFAALVVLGRAVVPRAERVGLRCLGLGDLIAAAAIGRRQAAAALGHAHRRRTDVWP